MNTRSEFGVVETVHHPLVSVRGLPHTFVGELIVFAKDITGQVTSIGDDLVEVMVFSPSPLTVGTRATRTGSVLSIPVGPDLIGRIINPLGTLLSGSPATLTEERPIDTAPKPLAARRRITSSLRSGVSVVDLMIPLGKGQRELIVGDRKTGKTTFVFQLIETQVSDGSVVVYAAIGKKLSEIKRIEEYLKQKKLSSQVVIVASAANDPPSVITLTPFTAMTVAEYMCELGKDVTVILDDVTTHAKFYREIALLGKRFPGRDSYPGDIFYTHARLLERAGCFSDPTKKNETVALSCLAIAETTDSDLTDYIISNLISITDGHLLFDGNLFSRGYRPAVHTGLSVTRVGKQTQTPLQRNMTHALSSFVSQYEKTRSLTHFGAELNDETKRMLSRGEALFAFLRQGPTLTFPRTVQILMTTGILLDWFEGSSIQAIQAARDTLNHNYQKEAIRKELHGLLEQAQTVDELKKIVTRHKDRLLSLCQP